MLHIGIIGYGYWGPNLLRNFRNLSNVKVLAVAESSEERQQVVRKVAPEIDVVGDANEIFQNPAIEAVVIATPISTHYTLAKQALENNKHVLVEKPLCTLGTEADELLQLAKSRSKVLMVDHTFLYTDAVQKIKSYVDTGFLGDLQYFDSTRINLGLFNPDYGVIWDLMTHDLSILNYLLQNKKPTGVSATGVSHTKMGIENIGYLTLFYEDDFVAHISTSWVSPVKVRKTMIGGSKKMIIYDDVEPSEKIKIYDSGYQVNSLEDEHKFLVDYRVGDIQIPKLNQGEALAAMASDFAKAVLEGSTPISNNELGYLVVRQMEAAQKSIAEKGAFVKL